MKTRPHAFCKTIFNAYSITGAGTTYGGVTTFNFSGNNQANFAASVAIGDLTSLQGLYRSFKMTKVVLTWRMRNSEFSDATQFPELYCRYNYDANAAAPSAVADYDGWENTKTHKFTNESPTFEYTIIPKVQKPLYAYTGALTSFGFGLGVGGPVPWLDLADAAGTGVPAGVDVPWYGYSWYFSNIPSGQIMAVDIEFHFKCKDQV